MAAKTIIHTEIYLMVNPAGLSVYQNQTLGVALHHIGKPNRCETNQIVKKGFPQIRYDAVHDSLYGNKENPIEPRLQMKLKIN